MILGTYHDAYGELLEDQWLLKLRSDSEWDGKKWIPDAFKTGFLSKLTQKGELPKSFLGWGEADATIYVFHETYRTGWKLLSWRFGKSQNWARVQHPEGFVLEIYLNNFLEVVKESTLDQGVILGEYKWESNRLLKKC